MKIRVLGCGTSTGVPVPGCDCAVCNSKDPKNSRLRTSALLELQESDLPPDSPLLQGDPHRVVSRILIDTGPDLRYQLLREKINSIDAVLYTHTHADHIFGIDDLRGICFAQGCPILAYASKNNVDDLKHYFPYIFDPDPNYLGGAPPKIRLDPITPYEKFFIAGVAIQPLPVLHGKLEILGFRVGSFAYLTDCSAIPERTKAELKNLDVLFLSGLRERPHPTHFSLQQARAQVEELAPSHAYLIHLSHDAEYQIENAKLKALPPPAIELAYDGLTVQTSAAERKAQQPA